MTSMTVFGPANAFVLAVADQVERRGFSCHLLSASVGWVESATPPIIVLADSEVGETALGELALSETAPPTDVLLVANSAATEPSQAMWQSLADACRDRHRLIIAWCPAPLALEEDAVLYAEVVMRRFLEEGTAEDFTAQIDADRRG